MTLPKKSLLIATVSILLLGVAAASYVYFQRQPVYFRLIEDPIGGLDAGRMEWLKDKNEQKGIHLYSLEPSHPYELLFYDTTYIGKARYMTPRIDAQLISNILRIDVSESIAADEGLVQDKILAYFILKEKPLQIEVYRDGVQQQYEMESGTEKISR